MKISPNTLSRKYLEERGYLVTLGECPPCGRRPRRDLYGMFDLQAIHESGDVIVVQCTDITNVSKRVRKISEHKNIGRVREANWTIHVHGWRPDGTVKVIDIS